MKASQWVDRLKTAQGWESDYRAAKELGVSRNTISNWRSRPDSTMDDETAVRVAEALGEPPAVVLFDQAAERSKSERARAEMLAALEVVRGKLAAVARTGQRLAVGGGRGRVDISSAAFAGGDPSELHRNTHCINRMERQRAAAEASLLVQLASRAAASMQSYGRQLSHA